MTKKDIQFRTQELVFRLWVGIPRRQNSIHGSSEPRKSARCPIGLCKQKLEVYSVFTCPIWYPVQVMTSWISWSTDWEPTFELICSQSRDWIRWKIMIKINTISEIFKIHSWCRNSFNWVIFANWKNYFSICCWELTICSNVQSAASTVRNKESPTHGC